MTKMTLTRAEKIASIRRYTTTINHRDALFLPDEEIYSTKLDRQSAEVIAKKICLWLGVKPYNVSFCIGEPTGYRKKNGHHTISAPQTDNSFLFAADITRACLEYYFQRQKQEVDKEYIELASIELGLGIVFMNTLTTRKKSELYYLKSWQYIELFCDYIDVNHFDRRTVMEHLIKKASRQMPKRFQNIKVLRPEPFVGTERVQTWRLITRKTGLIMIAVTIIFVGIFAWAQKPKKLSIEQQLKSENIDTLLRSYNLCEKNAEKLQMTKSEDDVFTYRHVEAQLSRCNSIKNKHDFLVQEYNQELRDEKLVN